MNETTSHKNEVFIFRRLTESFDQFPADLLQATIGHPIAKLLVALTIMVIVIRIIYRFANPASRGAGTSDGTAFGLIWGIVLSFAGFAVVHESAALLSGSGLTSWRIAGAWAAIGVSLLAILGTFTVAALSMVRYISSPTRAAGSADGLAQAFAWATGLLLGMFLVWVIVALYNREVEQTASPVEAAVSALNAANMIKWGLFIAGLFFLSAVFVVLMYIKDTRSVRWYWAVPLAMLRMTVYAILLLVFLLPAMQTWETTNKQSRVVILLDISPSVTTVTDEIGTRTKPKTRMDVILDFLSDENVAFLKNLLERNPVAVYTFGTRLDESPTVINQDDQVWKRSDWEAFARYDFKPFVLRGVSEEGKEEVKKHPDWQGEAPGTADWAGPWFARRNASEEELQQSLGLSNRSDAEKLKKNLDRLDKRIDVARTIALGTNVPDSATAAISREAPNMVQGLIIFSDGRSSGQNSDSGILELRNRANEAKIPVFTIAVGEDRQPASIANLEVTAPDSAPVDEAWKVLVEADGMNMANKEVEVFLDLFKPGNVPPKDQNVLEKNEMGVPDETLTMKMTFAPGDPPHGQVEFVIDPAKLKESLTTDSKDAAIKKRVLLEGKWAVRARIAKDPQEAYPYQLHVRTRPEINVVQQKLRILLVADAPGREFTFLRTLLVREMQDQRATLATYVQNEAGKGGHLTPEKGEQVLQRFPMRFDISGKKIDETERPYNLNEYDLIIAFDPDWSELTQQQAEDLARWVREGGGGLIFCAGPINTFQLARVEENSGKLVKLLEVLPVLPADIVALRFKPIPKTPRRLKLYPERIIGSELLKLDPKVPDDPVAGWEQFFTDRDKYVENPDLKVELYPHRGFYSAYPVKEVKPGSAVLAEFMDQSDTGEKAPSPWIVTNNPSAPYRTCFLGSPEFYRMRSYDPETKAGQEYFERFWFKLMKYMAAKRNIKAPRGRVMVSKEGVSGANLRVQARILNENAKPYEKDINAKFKIVQETPTGEKRDVSINDLTAKKAGEGATFDGYYAGQVTLDPKLYPPGDFLYRVEVDVPDSPGEKLLGEFRVRASNPELDNTRPDFVAMLKMASDFNKDYQDTLPDRVRTEFGNKLPKEGGMPRLAFRIADKEMLKLIPECTKTVKSKNENRGPVRDLWDMPVNLDMTRTPVLLGLLGLCVTALSFLLFRVLWWVVGPYIPNWLRIVGAVLWVLASLSGLLAFALVVLLIEPSLGFSWCLACGFFIFAIVAFRAEPWVGVMILGGLAVLSGGSMLGIWLSSYSGEIIPIAIALVVVVTLLSVEWSTRKLLRLA
jgi:hypothetical protein